MDAYGSLTQKQLKAKLEAKLAADPTLEIDVNRALTTSDLSISDLTAEIGIELPKKWTERFQTKAEFKRVTKATAEVAESTSDQGSNSGNTTGGDDDDAPGAGGGNG